MTFRGMRRRLLACTVVCALATSALVGCSTDGRETVRFTFSKREALEFMQQKVDDFNASQTQTRVVMDTSGVDVVSASFVRGNPPDLMLANYNFETARFVQRCALSDLGTTEAASLIRDDLRPLLEQYGTCDGRTSALPYSVVASSVIYNKEKFAKLGLSVPTTWDELIDVSDTLSDAGEVPFYATFKDDWTVAQGWFDYTVGGSVDVLDFFAKRNAAGAEIDSESEVSFAKGFDASMERMLTLTREYTNEDAGSRGYNDGNTAFANGEGAMYLQGPWALSEIARSNPDIELGTFPLPMTDSADDLAVRVNMDLAAMIPAEAANPGGAREFLEYLFQPDIVEAYNKSQLGFSPLTGAQPPDDPRVAGMVRYYDDSRVYQGASVLIPKTVPVFGYAQAMVYGEDPAVILSRMDADWSRLAFRAPIVDTAGEGKR